MIAYFDCFSGAAGDMILGALIDAGADPDQISKSLSSAADIDLRVEQVHRGGIRATKVQLDGDVRLDRPSDAGQLIKNSSLENEVTARALRILNRLVLAEAAVHGVEVDEVHFHELSGTDTVGDILGSAIAMQMLGIETVYCSAVVTGTGTIGSAHGTLPVPAPAVTELLKGAPLKGRDIEMETITPTGAAILAEIVSSWGPMPSMTLEAVGYGAGTKEVDGIPNVVRVLLGNSMPSQAEGLDELILEANIDDMNPELFEWVAERLFAVGAADVWVQQVIGKKGRPAAIISVLAPAHLVETVRGTLIAETSTIGVRATRVTRWMLERRWIEVQIEGRPVRVKVAFQEGKRMNVSPEYSDCAEVARQTGLPLKEVFRRASAAVDQLPIQTKEVEQ